ncbi:carbohydrate porin [Pseudomonas sp. NPDC089752]|uniref:carbohydrate porin n=1 Tax=Pseudomonas sp. NPDC089752 TaxID=3364472 RepID=UPI0037F3BAAD
MKYKLAMVGGAAVAIATLGAGNTWAQESSSSSPAPSATMSSTSESSDNPSPTAAYTGEGGSQWMLGDWGGLRTELERKGYSFSMTYRNDSAYNAKGGYNHDRKWEYADQFAFTMTTDLEKVMGLKDSTLVVTLTDRNGKDLSATRLIDPRQGQLGSAQNVFGRGNVTRLTQFLFRQKLDDGKFEYTLGRFGPDAFGQFTCDFQNLDFCGNSGGNWHGDDWYNFPIGQWAASAKYQFQPEWAFQIGIFEQNPTLLENRNAFKVSTSGGDGVLIPAEIIWSPKQALFGLPAEYRIGGFFNTADATDVYEGADGQPQPLTPSGEFKEHSNRKGWWYVARQTVGLINNDPLRNIEVFSQGFWNDRDTGYVARHYTLGVTINGPFDARPQDAIGIAVGGLSVADDVSKRQRLINEINNVSDYDNPRYLPVQGDEYSAEIYYGFKMTNWLTLRPNVQYIKHPGGVNQVDSALLAGLMIRASF